MAKKTIYPHIDKLWMKFYDEKKLMLKIQKQI